MKYYIFIENEKITGKAQCPCKAEGLRCIEVDEKIYDDIERYIFNGQDIVLNPDYEAQELQKAKDKKYNEALNCANEYISNGQALYEFEEGKHIEATDGNIGKFSAYALGFISGAIKSTVEWTTKEDEIVEFTQEQVSTILLGLGAVQREVWTVKFPFYIEAIEQAKTVEEIEAIEIDYKE